MLSYKYKRMKTGQKLTRIYISDSVGGRFLNRINVKPDLSTPRLNSELQEIDWLID
jgi:hypothetical protein